MKQLSQSTLSSAVAAAIATVAAMGPAPASAVGVSDSPNSGNVLVFPYYTARDGWTSLFNITNLIDATVPLKIRFRESYNSRDVLDFTVIMSPFDVWTAWVTEGPDGPRLYTRDSTCTSPLMQSDPSGARYFDFTNVGYSGAVSDGGPTDLDRTREGHLEVISMGLQKDDGKDGDDIWAPAVYYAKHVDGKPRDCAKVDAEFVAQNKNFDPETNPSGFPNAIYSFTGPEGSDTGGFEEYLKGNFSLVNINRGVGAGGEALAFEEFGPFPGEEATGPGSNLITAQEYPFFLEPSLASDNGLWVWSARSISKDMDGKGVDNEWSINESNGVMTDWVITLPTKNLHVDIDDNPQAGVNPDRFRRWNENPPSGPARVLPLCEESGTKWQCDCDSDRATDGDGANGFEVIGKDSFKEAVLACANAMIDENASNYYPLPPFTQPFDDGKSCITVEFNLYDREEGSVRSGGTSISPAPPIPKDSICYETNVLTFGGADSTLGSSLAQTVDIDGLVSGAQAGWLSITWDYDQSWGTGSNEGVPAFGFALKTRDFGVPTLSFGQLMEHSYGQSDWQYD